MKDFIEKNHDNIHGVLSGFDRLILRGYLPIQNGRGMASFLRQRDAELRDLKGFLTEQAQCLKDHAMQMAKVAGRPFRYLETGIPMEQQARQMAEAEGVERGLVCIYSIVEPCRTFSFPRPDGNAFVRSSFRKCLHLYYYFMDPEFGLIHVKVQTWFPVTLQVYVNGQEWLSRRLDRCGIRYTKMDNVFVRVGDLDRAQAISDRLASFDFVSFLERYARVVNPLMDTVLAGLSYYWVAAQAEYATDVIFKDRESLATLCPRLLDHALTCFGAKEVMTFLGRKLCGQFRGEVVTDLRDLSRQRIPGARVKHRMKENWIKMYDKAGVVLRIETVINNPEEFRVRKRVTRKGRKTTEWVQMRKGVKFLFRYRDVSRSANSRYLDALAVVSNPGVRVRQVERITRRVCLPSGRSAKAFNPLSREDAELFRAVMAGEHLLRGFRNSDIRRQLRDTHHLDGLQHAPRRAGAKVSRILHRFHVHGLIAKIPHSRRWRTTDLGRRVMSTSIRLREISYPQLLERAA